MATALLCTHCIGDAVLRTWAEARGDENRCDYCGNEGVCLPIEAVAEEVDRVIREFYTLAPEEGHVVDWTDNIAYYAEGESADEILRDIGFDDGLVGDLLAILSANESRDVQDGDDAMYHGSSLRHIDAHADEFLEVWERFEQRLKHEVRFFDEEGRQMLDRLFGDLPTLGGGRAVVTLDPADDCKIYRARIVNDESQAEEFIRDPSRHVGPPPPALAPSGRMNPAGIPAFYGAFSKPVALAEKRPPVGSLVAIGEFSVLRPVRLLDMSFLPFAYHEESIFSPRYDEARSKVRFLELFHRRISRPVLPSDEILGYLPTQAVAAYVSTVMGLDGIIYSSTQIGAEGESTGEQLARTLCNVVLFRSAGSVERTPAPPHPRELTFDGVLPPFNAISAPLDEGPEDGDTVGASAASDTPAGPVPEQNARTAANLGERTSPSVIPEPDGLTVDGFPAALRVKRDPELERVHAVKVDTYSLFAHLYEDGRVLIARSDEEEED